MSGNGIADLSGFDIRSSTQDGADMVLLDPAGRATNVTFRVRGTDSDAFTDKFKEQVRRAKERGQRQATEEEREAEFCELYATLIASWTPARITFDKGGEALECTPRNVAGVIQRHSWVLEQVRRFADNRANFLPGPASN
jgi:hypothetical protein